MENGMDIGVGIDLSRFKKDLSYVNKELLSISGQQAVVDIILNFANDEELNDIKEKYETIFENISNLKVNHNGKDFQIKGIDDAIKALGQYRTEFEKAFKNGNVDKQTDLTQSIIQIQQYITTIGELYNQLRNWGVTTPDIDIAKNAENAFRERFKAELKEQEKAQKEKAKLAEKAEKEQEKNRQDRAIANVREYDEQIKRKEDTLSPELFDLRKKYSNGESLFNNTDKSSIGSKDVDKRLSETQSYLQELEKIYNSLGVARTKGDKAYKKQIEGEYERIKAEVDILKKLKAELETNATPSAEQSDWSKRQEEKQRREVGKTRAAQSAATYKEQIRFEKEQARQAEEVAKAKAETDKRIQKEIEEGRKIYNQLKSSIVREQDQIANRIANGGNSSKELADMRKFYQEQARQADIADKPKRDRKAINDEIKHLEKRRKLLKEDVKVPTIAKVQEEIRMQRQLIALLEKRNRTYKSGSSNVTNAAISQARQELAVLQEQNDALNRKNRTISHLKMLMTQYLSIFSIFDFTKNIVETTGYFEQQKVALEGILGSAVAAEQAISRLKDISIESPFQFKEIIGFTKQLSAYGIEQENLIDTTKKLADISTGLGVDMSRLILAYGQVRAAAVLRGQELRQFTEAGIPMVQALADKFTQLNGRLVTTGEVFELISTRQVSFDMVSDVLSEMTSEGGKFYNMQEQITDTLYGQVQKLRDLWNINLNDIGSTLNKILRLIIEGLQAIVKESKSIIWALGSAGIGAGLKFISKYFNDVKKHINDLIIYTKLWIGDIRRASGFANKLKVTFAGIGKALVSNIGIAALSAIAGLIAKAVISAREFKDELNKIDSSFAKDTTKYINGLDKLIGKLSVLREGAQEYNKTLDTLKANYSEFINPAIIDQLIAERKQLDATSDGWGRLRDSIVESIAAKKEYERHEARKEKSGIKAGEKFKDEGYGLSDKFSNSIGTILVGESFIDVTHNRLSDGLNNMLGERGVDKNDLDSYVRDSVNSKEFATALNFAIDSFFGSGEVSQDDLKKRLEKSMKQYGISNIAGKYIADRIDIIWEELTSTDEWEQYMIEHNAIQNDNRYAIKKRFEQARIETSKRNEGRWEDGMSIADYNPANIIKAGQYDTSNAVRELIGGIQQTIKEGLISHDYTKDELFVGGEEGIKSYEEAIRALNAELSNMSIGDFQDAEKVNHIAEALHNLSSTIKDSALLSQINEITKQFTQDVGIKTGRAAAISTNIEKNLLSSGVLDRDAKDFYARYLPTDMNVDELRDQIASMYKSVDTKIQSFGGTQLNEANKKYVDELKKQREMLKILAGEQYYDVDLSKKDTRTNLTLDYELTEFFNRFKEAYSTYRNAAQQGGAEYGVQFMKNNRHMQENFGDFFHGFGGEAFQKVKDERLGKGSDAKTIGETLQDTFITEGLENGVIDFESAARKMADELEKYYKGDEKHRKSFMSAAKDLRKWADSIASDNLNAELMALKKTLGDLSLSFEKTTQSVEMYRKLMQNGTAETLGKAFGMTREEAIRPNSTRQKGYINNQISAYNTQLKDVSKGTATGVSIANINGIGDIYAALKTLTNLQQMNNGNFATTAAGSIATAELEKSLKSLLKTMTEEMASISGKAFSGDELSDVIANAVLKSLSSQFSLDSKQAVAIEHTGNIDMSAIGEFINSNREQANAIFDAFMKQEKTAMTIDALSHGIDFSKYQDKFLDIIERMGDDVPQVLKDELQDKLKDLESAINNLNASTGALSSFAQSARDYRNAEKEAKAEYDSVSEQRDLDQSILDVYTSKFGKNASMVQEISTLSGMDNRTAEQETRLTELKQQQANIGITDEDIQMYTNLSIAVANANQRLTELGENGSIEAFKNKLQALEGMEKSLTAVEGGFSAMQNAVTSIVGAFQSVTNTTSKFYDVMNDGENPEWMTTTNEALGDFIENFKSAMAPVMAIVGAIAAVISVMKILQTVAATTGIAMSTLLVVILPIIAAAAVIAAVVTAIQAHDKAIERDIEDMKKQVEEFDKAINNLDNTAERMVGLDKLKTQIDAIGLSLSKATEYANMAAAEEKKKNSDEDKIGEYRQQQEDAMHEYLNGIRSIVEEITASTSDWAGSMGDAIRSAFQNGENAARAFRDSVKEMIGDIVQNMLQMAILEPLIEDALREWVDYDAIRKNNTKVIKDSHGNDIQDLDQEGFSNDILNALGDPEKAEEFYKQMLAIGNTAIDAVNGMPSFLQDAYKYNSELSSLSGGIEGITEDTARRLEALSNSQLGALLNIQSILQNYIGGAGTYGGSPMADINATMATIQSDTTGIRMATQTILSEIKSLRTTNSQPLHVKVV